MSEKRINKDLNIVIKEIDDNNRTIVVIGSKEVVDRDGDIIIVKGVDLKNWKKNPVVMLNHEYHDFPIAKGVGKKAWVEDNKLMFKLQFATEEENPKAEKAYRLYKSGFMGAFSISFLPNFEKVEFPEKHKKGARRIFHESELLEISGVSVPANAEALMANINKAWDEGKIDGMELNELEGLVKELTDDDVKKPKVDEPEVDLQKELNKKDIEIAKLKLMLKEQDMEDEEDGFDSYLGELFDEFKPARSTDDAVANPEQMDEDWVNEALNSIEENN